MRTYPLIRSRLVVLAAWLIAVPAGAAVEPYLADIEGAFDVVPYYPDAFGLRARELPEDPDCPCEQILGERPVSFAQTLYWMGTAARIDLRPGQVSELCEFAMELELSAPTDLYFTVHRKVSGGFQCELEPLWVSDPRWKTSTNTFMFFSTGLIDPPVILRAGEEYTLGVAWGEDSVAMVIGDVPADPGFSDGVVTGSLATYLTAEELPPPDDENVIGQCNSVRVFNMEICLAPQEGACCDSQTATCTEVLERECTCDGCYFHGERTTCPEVLCPFGACCTACGECLDGYVPGSCAEAGGIAHWPGTACPVDPDDQAWLCPPITGACCLGTGDNTVCIELCAADCADYGGFYHGDDTTCDPNLCFGACCVPGGCIDTTSNQCTNIYEGDYKGDGKTCARLFENPELECGGACCRGFSSLATCSVVPTRGDCTTQFPQMAYLGDGVSCPTGGDEDCGELTTDRYPGCCLPDGMCINTTAAFCGYSWVLGEPLEDGGGAPLLCSPGACTLGACCFRNGGCQILTETGCDGLGGIGWIAEPGGTCTPNTCAGGACCLCDGTCGIRTEESCRLEGGLYQGDATLCPTGNEACQPFGACCGPNGQCVNQLSSAACDDLFAAPSEDPPYYPSWWPCEVCADVAAEPECDERGACCAPDGTCSYIDERFCGDPLDCWVFDPDNTCDDPEACPPTGACCLPGSDAPCLLLSEDCCGMQDGGYYAGDGTDCPHDCPFGACVTGGCVCEWTVDFHCDDLGGVFFEGAPCEDIGACCARAPLQACQCTDEANCPAPDYVFQGPGTTCGGTVCDTGACCTERVSCTDFLFGSECRDLGGEFHVNLTCTDRPCPGACCLDVGACLRSRATQCSELGGRFTPEQECAEIECRPHGACCVAGECISARFEQECLGASGVYQGNTTSCEADLCDPGGCCDLFGRCVDDQVASQCAGDNIFDTFGCGNFECLERGACCHADGTYTIETEDECAALGEFAGVGVECYEGACTLQACCLPGAGSCATHGPLICEAIGGTVPGNAPECDLSCSGGDWPCSADEDCKRCSESSEVYCHTAEDCPKHCQNDPGRTCVDASDCVDSAPCEMTETCEWQGETCDSALCVRGACCDADGACAEAVITLQCADEGDDFYAGRSCASIIDDNLCFTRRACCTEISGCTIESQADCQDAGGTYSPNVFTCTAELCDVGACCRANGTCADTITGQQCANSGGLFQGSGTSCEVGGVCHACCLDDGTCTNSIGGTCAGNYLSDADCTSAPCPGACCEPDGTCSEITALECALAEGNFNPGLPCGGDLICEPFGACCRDGACTTEFISACLDTGSVYQGDGKPCVEDLCTLGVCCTAEGICEDLKVDLECADVVGDEFSAGESCTVLTCRPRGACCLPDESCAVYSEQECSDALGVWYGVGTPCTENYCVTGACCHLNGDCDEVTGRECAADNDEFTAGAVCSAIVCNPRGACCLFDGSCGIEGETACTTVLGGDYQGHGIPCDPNPCRAICITDSVPPDRAIDARIPDGGWDSIEITFSGNASMLTAADFEVTQKKADALAEPGPAITAVIPDALDNKVVELTLGGPIVPGAWTRFAHVDSGTSTCLGHLPADAGQDRLSNAADIGTLIDCLNEVAGPCEAWVCDIDRRGACTGADIAALIDLLNGADAFTEWDAAGIDIDSPCTADPPCMP